MAEYYAAWAPVSITLCILTERDELVCEDKRDAAGGLQIGGA
jgi:hypothetical protein